MGQEKRLREENNIIADINALMLLHGHLFSSCVGVHSQVSEGLGNVSDLIDGSRVQMSCCLFLIPTHLGDVPLQLQVRELSPSLHVCLCTCVRASLRECL